MSHVAPMRVLNRPRPTVEVERRPDGTLVLASGRTLPDDLPPVIDLLQRAAERRPDVTFLAERRGPGEGAARPWQRLTYAEAWARTGAIASWLIAQGYVVRTRADADTVESRTNDTGPRDAAIASGAQWVSTDYPVPDPRFSDYMVAIPDGHPARCNPINAPAACRSVALERIR